MSERYKYSAFYAARKFIQKAYPRDIHSMRQATQHSCLPSLLGDGDKLIEIYNVCIVHGEEKKYFYCAD
jgi:hypothetical protein